MMLPKAAQEAILYGSVRMAGFYETGVGSNFAWRTPWLWKLGLGAYLGMQGGAWVVAHTSSLDDPATGPIDWVFKRIMRKWTRT